MVEFDFENTLRAQTLKTVMKYLSTFRYSISRSFARRIRLEYIVKIVMLGTKLK